MAVKRRIRFTYLLITLFCLLVFTILCSNYENSVLHNFIFGKDIDNEEKIELMQKAINSSFNHATCVMPDLPVYAPEMMKFIKDVPPLKCVDNTNEDWIECEGSLCIIKKQIKKKFGNIVCIFRDVIRDTDMSISYGPSVQSTVSYELINSDFVDVVCRADNGMRWYNVLFGIRKNIKSKPKKPNQLSVLMFGFDSLSQNAVKRKLPKTYEYITKVLGGHMLSDYNIVGDGTPQALTPILTGHTELELPDTRKRIASADFVDVYPMIWKNYAKDGYITSFNEDMPNVGIYTYRLKGFQRQPTDHYMHTYYLAIDKKISMYKHLCVGDKPRHKVMLDYQTQILRKHRHSAKFLFSFHGELSHDDINLIGLADDDVVQWIKDLKNENLLNDTVLIFMADHGNRFADVRNTLQGKLEERLPFFSFTFPPWFKDIYPNEYNNFVANTQRLSTPFDIHATLLDILTFGKVNKKYRDLYNHKADRSMSLFKKIPATRSCADAYIEPHWCACLNWRPYEQGNYPDVVIRGVQAVVELINDFTSDYRDRCEILTVIDIEWAAMLAPSDNLLLYKKNSDTDGFIGDFSAKTKVTQTTYQVKFRTNPGKSIFEASLTHNKETNQFSTKITDISRVNKYGNQALCIMEENPELRKYCYCRY